MSDDQCDDHSFPEEREPSGRVILAPCLTCGMSAGDGMQALKAAIERETFARVTADCASELATAAVAKARAEAFEEAAKKFMAVKETEDKLCHHPRMCVVTVTESLLRMAADCRAKAKE